ncbi:MAG TPA: S53 family peptidase, partial [Verrucomicrobiae bacterium]|nr:S53 family peptidase [Verrucomicrobiae bacterium]
MRPFAFVATLLVLPLTLAAVPRQPLRAPAAVLWSAATRGSYVGTISPRAVLPLYVTLAGRHANQVDATIAAQNDPSSPLFRRYLTPAQYGAYFGAAPRDYAQAIALLRSSGFRIVALPPNRRGIVVRAPASAVEALFGTPIDLRVYRGRTFYTVRYAPRIPAALHAVAISGLDDFALYHSHAHRGTPGTVIGKATAYGPADIRSVYDLDPIYANYDGSGKKVVDATFGLAKQSDFQAFANRFGIKAKLESRSSSEATPPPTDETTLDVEWMAAIAPGAKIVQVTAPTQGDTNRQFFEAFQEMYGFIVNLMSDDHIVSTSWGLCEAEAPLLNVNGDEALFAQANLEGQWWLAAAGDDGSDDCEITAQGSGITSVDYPGSSPYVVSVGGTEVTPQSKTGGNYRGWSSEVVWETGKGYSTPGAGGGGASILFGKPIYQRRMTPYDGARDVPDVALMADWNDPNGAYFIYYKGRWQSNWGGTSFAAPEWAAFLTLVQQRAGKISIQSPLYRLYALGRSNRYTSLFHDITQGCNGLYGVDG